MPFDGRVLVVGTTPDYIQWIRQVCPGQALFLTEPQARAAAKEPVPTAIEELLSDLTDFHDVCLKLKQHLFRFALGLKGIVSFDCESMALAAFLAREFQLPYPSPEAIGTCRNKYATKQQWRHHGVDTPRGCLVEDADAAVNFLQQTGAPIVLKPLFGSGSEMIFKCQGAEDCRAAFDNITAGLLQRKAHRLYQADAGAQPQVLAESLVSGEEYSCDFIIENAQASVLRLTRKVPAANGFFGVTLGYVLEEAWPMVFCREALETILARGACALGLDRALCMVDFMVIEEQVVLLEMTPRPGGDCIPFLLRHARGLDVLKLFMDFACGKRGGRSFSVHVAENGCPSAVCRKAGAFATDRCKSLASK